MIRRISILGRALAFAALALAPQAHAGIFRAYLSVNGNDLNPCTLPLPCRLLPSALAAVNDGGEIWMLDSANFNGSTVPITKSVTILAVPGALGSIVANNGDGLSIGAGAANVTLRNLVFIQFAGNATRGVSVTSAASVTMEGCEVYGLQTGVDIGPGSGAKLTIKDSTVRDSRGSGISLGSSSKLVARNVNLTNNGGAGLSIAGSTATITGGSISGNATGIAVDAAFALTSQVVVAGTAISGNTAGIALTSQNSAASHLTLSGASLTQNTTGVTLSGVGAVAFSRGNNAFRFNGTDVAGGALTTLAAQ